MVEIVQVTLYMYFVLLSQTPQLQIVMQHQDVYPVYALPCCDVTLTQAEIG